MTDRRGKRNRNSGLGILATGAVALWAVAVTPAAAVDESHFVIDTTADLARLCGAQPSEVNYSQAVQMCQGYMMGVHHFHEALAAETDNDIYCSRDGAEAPTRNEIMADFSSWVASTPGAGGTEALEGLLRWAAKTFPCG